jgi:hypothetical protein
MAIETKSGVTGPRSNTSGGLIDTAPAGPLPMDRMSRSVYRLWGPLGSDGRLHGSPSFAEELAQRCAGNLDLRVTDVSKWSFGQQLEHLYLTGHYVLDRLEEAIAGQNPTGRKGFWGYGLLVGGFIPRGVFPTIPQLKPASGTLDHIVPLRESLAKRLEQLAWDLHQIKLATGRSRHPRMKYLTASEWLFFADIHHRHHLAIMRDILKAAR